MMLNTSYFGGSFRQQNSSDNIIHDNNRDETHPTNSTIADENSQVLKSNRDSQAESNIEVIKKCLDVMVTQTQSLEQFEESLNFLAQYKTLQIEYLTRLLQQDAFQVQNPAISTPSHKMTDSEAKDEVLGRRQNFSISDSLKNDTVNLEAGNYKSQQTQGREVTMRDLAVEQLVRLRGYQSEQHSIQSSVAKFLVDSFFIRGDDFGQLNPSSLVSLNPGLNLTQQSSQKSLSGRRETNWLDWNMRIDINRSKERSIQTSPMLINGQSWIFLIDLGNQNTNSSDQDCVWFKFSVIQCKTKQIDSIYSAQTTMGQEEEKLQGRPLAQYLSQRQRRSRQSRMQKNQSTENKNLEAGSNQLHSKKMKLIKKRTGGSITNPKGSRNKSGYKPGSMQLLQKNSQETSVNESMLQTMPKNADGNQPQIFKFELCAEIVRHLSNQKSLEMIVLHNESYKSIKSKMGSPNMLL